MTRDQARRVLERYDRGLLSSLERAKLTEEITIAILREAARSESGRVTFSLSDATFYPQLEDQRQ
jgi:hypothetical protein